MPSKTPGFLNVARSYATETVEPGFGTSPLSSEAAQTLWDFAWREFCDWYLEVKKRFQENSGLDSHWQATLTVYEARCGCCTLSCRL